MHHASRPLIDMVDPGPLHLFGHLLRVRRVGDGRQVLELRAVELGYIILYRFIAPDVRRTETALGWRRRQNGQDRSAACGWGRHLKIALESPRPGFSLLL